MEKQVDETQHTFPVVDAVLSIPSEGDGGKIGICTNTLAPGQVLNEIPLKKRENISVLGSLIVNRDGVERMMVNSLAHPAMKYLILFSEEAALFFPSTNLLQTMMYGVSDNENKVRNAVGGFACYPHLPSSLVEEFRKRIVPIPLFMSSNKESRKIVSEYLETLRDLLGDEMTEFLKKVNSKEKIYYDVLNETIEKLESLDLPEKSPMDLDAADFKHLQPPKIKLSPAGQKPEMPFKVENKNGLIALNIEVNGERFYMEGNKDFLMGYSLMKKLGAKKECLSSKQQIFLGAELSRVDAEINNNIEIESFVSSSDIKDGEQIEVQNITKLLPDEKYYYRVATKENGVSVSCLSYDTCEDVFELISEDASAILFRLAEDDRFDDYEMDILHRIDVGGQVAKAGIAFENNYLFVQDLPLLFKENKDHLPFFISAGDDFLNVHKNIIQKIYTAGLTEDHADERKGMARSASVLAVFDDPQKVFKSFPFIYAGEREDTEKMREDYKNELLKFETAGNYAYGQRTRSFFGFDQLTSVSQALSGDPNRAAIIQRYAPDRDMELRADEDTGELKATEDPCLTHDIFWIKNGELNSLHIARAHNVVNAYPQNLFGLYDAYYDFIREKTGASSGKMYMLSNRANILLLTESQKSQSILAEPSKPVDNTQGLTPPVLDKDSRPAEGELYYKVFKGEKLSDKPESELIRRLENYKGVDTIQKAIDYLSKRGVKHNNPVLSSYIPGESEVQSSELVFYQANVFAGKVYATGVFVNSAPEEIPSYIDILRYISTRFSEELNYPLGDIEMFYVG